MKKIKLTDERVQKLRKELGLSEGIINLKTGIISFDESLIISDNADTDSVLRFENIVGKSVNLEDLLVKLKISGGYLEDAIRVCIEKRRCNMRTLLAELKVTQDAKKFRSLSQNAIKIQINEELSEWIASNRVIMREYTLTYFLNTIVKGIR